MLHGHKSVVPGPAHVVGIGIFDGVHLGHQALLNQVRALAEQDRALALAYTFHPHPARVLAQDLAPRLIEPIEARVERLFELGMSSVLIEPFTLELAKTSAQEFVRNVLVEKLRAKRVVVGADFTFGHKQSGNVAVLRELGREHGFVVHPIDLVRVDGIPASSTKVREFVSSGAMRGAALLLGRPFSLSGIVQRGAGRGVGLGFGTANLEVKNELLPARGVYAAFAHGSFGKRMAMVNVGVAPTFGEQQLKIEAHLLDYDGAPLYGSVMILDFIDHIRDERRFENVEALKAQIHADVARGREILSA